MLKMRIIITCSFTHTLVYFWSGSVSHDQGPQFQWWSIWILKHEMIDTVTVWAFLLSAYIKPGENEIDLFQHTSFLVCGPDYGPLKTAVIWIWTQWFVWNWSILHWFHMERSLNKIHIQHSVSMHEYVWLWLLFLSRGFMV